MPDLAKAKVLSLHQPWASLMVYGLKRVETRSWRPSYFGPLIIHAAKAFPAAYSDLHLDPYFADAFEIIGDLSDLPRGAVVGAVSLWDVDLAHTITGTISAREQAFGDYSRGRYGWIMRLGAHHAFADPVPARGYQRLFRPTLWPKAAYDRVAAQLAEVARA